MYSMKNAIIVHGKPTKEIYYSDAYPSSSNFAWIPWLQKQLMIRDIKTDTPEMPLAYEPEYTVWKTELERFDIHKDTVLIGHSAGGGFLVRWLSENKNVSVGKLVLVAPSLDPDKKSKTGFCDFEIDSELSARVSHISVFISNDAEHIKKSVEILQEAIPEIQVVTLEGMGHFIPAHMGRVEFPELLAEILR